MQQLQELSEFSTGLIGEALFDVQTQVSKLLSHQDLLEVCCWLYLVGTGHMQDGKLVLTKMRPIEREITWNFIKACFSEKHMANAAFVFGSVEGLVASDIHLKF